MNPYVANPSRYGDMVYRRCGDSGLKLPAVSLGLWHNFGDKDDFDNMRAICRTAFDLGVTLFDVANNYGPAAGAAEENLGRILKKDFAPYRDELLIATKAGYEMWAGPYGNFGSKKYLVASLDQSLKRLGLDYVDIFYHHRPDPDTPLEETVRALDGIVRQGKALYVGISNYSREQTERAAALFRELGTPFIINQVRYSLLDRGIERDGLKAYAAQNGIGLITYSPLAQGLLTDRYLDGIPDDSRIRTDGRFLKEQAITPDYLRCANALNEIAHRRGQTLAQMALAWILRDEDITGVLVGASRPSQIADCVETIHSAAFSEEELAEIDAALR
ncbi:MAG: aldo/keto reductase [Eubacteriales bacterium]